MKHAIQAFTTDFCRQEMEKKFSFHSPDENLISFAKNENQTKSGKKLRNFFNFHEYIWCK